MVKIHKEAFHDLFCVKSQAKKRILDIDIEMMEKTTYWALDQITKEKEKGVYEVYVITLT